MIKIDVIILSSAKDKPLKQLTQQTIDSLLSSEDPAEIEFNIIVIESFRENFPYQFENTQTLYPKEKFGFHKYLNIGIKASYNDFVCLCNNDLIFHKGWASCILSAMKYDENLMSTSPYCPIFHGSRQIKNTMQPMYGYTNGIHLAGWCIFVKRAIFDKIGLLDEKFVFWCCDDDYRMTLQKEKVAHALICNAIVEHLGSVSLNKIFSNKSRRSFKTKYFTTAQQHYFDYKWFHKSKIILYLKYLKLYLLDR